MSVDIEAEIINQGIPESWQASYRKAKAGNRPAAVKTMCGQCQGWEDRARKAIRDCADVGCPLWHVRPFQGKTTVEDSGQDEYDYAMDRAAEGDLTLLGSSREINDTIREDDAIELASQRILAVLSITTLKAKSDIIFESDLDPSLWTLSINRLLSQGLVERIGERKSTRYRKVQP